MFRFVIFCLGIFPSWIFAAVIVDNGTPQAVIVVSENAPDSVQYAVGELQSYLKEVSGATLTIQHEKSDKLFNIFVGESEFTKKLGLSTDGLKSDGFKIIMDKNWLAIFGRDYAGPPISGMRNPWQSNEVINPTLKLGAFGETGTLYGVYRFLEDVCDIRWYMPGALGTVVPKKETIAIDKIDLKISPEFRYRYTWFCNFDGSETDARWYRRAGFGADYPAQIIDSFGLFLKYKDSHPEYFSLIGGNRDFSNLSTVVGPGNLCLSNPDVAKQWIANINAYFDENPNQFIFPLSPNDGMAKICECTACQKQLSPNLGETGKFSNYVWTFVNKVAEGVAKKHPDKFVGCIAYESYNYPPSNIGKLNPNVAVMICKTRGNYPNPAYYQKIQESIAGWQKKTDNLYFWEYYLYSWAPWRNFPIVFPHLIASDLKSLKGICKGEFIESESTLGGTTKKIDLPGMSHINLYLTAKLLWNPDQNVDELLNEYYGRFYGTASEPMKAFWTLAEEIWMTRSSLGDPINVYRKSDMAKLMGFLETAKLKTSEGSAYRKRVELIEAEFLPAQRKLSNLLVTNPPKWALSEATDRVKIDGILNDSIWKKVEPMYFVDNDGEAAQFKTWMLAACDKDNLYLAFLNYEPEMSKLNTKATQRDQNQNPGMWDDDSVEIFIVSDPMKKDYFQWIINAKSLIWDGKSTNTIMPDLNWNSHIEAKTRLEPNRWVLEVRIPFKDLGSDFVYGKTIMANFYRNRYCEHTAIYSGWSPTLTYQHANTDRFGTISFIR
ncbi:MAG: DUF4838 domain-containing protein [Lentisphaerae bacterium]|nr:DUF4838 domain-containing protein [Lentisphaerota bacterium]